MMQDDSKKKLFKKIEELSTIHISDSPESDGLTVLSAKLSEIVSKHSQATVLSNKVISILGQKKRAFDTLKTLYKIKLNRTLCENHLVKDGCSKDERISIASMLLQDEQLKLQQQESEVGEWEDINACVDNCLHTIVLAKEAISKQQSNILCQLKLGEINPNFGSR